MKRCFLLLSVAFLSVFPQAGSWADDFANTPKLVVSGEGSVFKPADQMEAILGVITTSENTSEALSENKQRMHRVIENLRALGLDEKDYETGKFFVHPIYQKTKGSEEEGKGKIVNYEAISGIQIKTKKIDLADKIISAAIQGGVNEIYRVNFSINRPQTYREEAIKLATQHALEDAASLASAAGVTIKRVLNVSLGSGNHFPAPRMLSNKITSPSAEAQGILEPGNAEIYASVNITFEIG